MSEPTALSVVVAVQHAEANLADILDSLTPDRYPHVEFLFLYTEADPGLPDAVSSFGNARAHTLPAGSLIPHMWAKGIRLAKGKSVALTTAHVIPEKSWIDRLLSTDLHVHPGVGGVIANHPASGYKDWAVYFLRYITFSPPATAEIVNEIAADNAVYRRDDLLAYPELLDIGFWEPSFHARFRQNGMHLMLDPGLRVIHRNRYSARQFFVQRFEHGRAFGLARAVQLSLPKRLFLILLSPVLPLVFLRKIISAVVRQGAYTKHLAGAFPWLIYFLSGWGFGEARGYLDSLCRKSASTNRNA